MIELCLEASVAYALKIPNLETVAPFLIYSTLYDMVHPIHEKFML